MPSSNKYHLKRKKKPKKTQEAEGFVHAGNRKRQQKYEPITPPTGLVYNIHINRTLAIMNLVDMCGVPAVSELASPPLAWY